MKMYKYEKQIYNNKLKYVSKFLWFLYLHMNEKLAIFFRSHTV